MSESELGVSIENQAKKIKTPQRLMKTTKATLELLTYNPSSIPVLGKEHLEEIPSGRKVIVATTHISDIDGAAALYRLGNNFDLIVAHHSTHKNILRDPVAFIGSVAAGGENSLYVKSKQEGKIVKGEFNPEDYIPMKEALDRGKTVLIAAYFDPYYNWRLPDRGGIGAAYLAQLSDAIILPVSVDTEAISKTGAGVDILKAIIKDRRRPRAKVFVGKPIDLPKVDVGDMDKILKEKKKGKGLSIEDQEKLTVIRSELGEQSTVIMNSLASMLPPEKRGKWTGTI